MFAELNGGGIDWGINTENMEYKKFLKLVCDTYGKLLNEIKK